MNQSMLIIEKSFLVIPTLVSFLFQSIPFADTPAVLKNMLLYLACSSNWNFLTGERQSIFDLAPTKVCNLYADPETSKVNGGFEHSGFIYFN
jgi:protein SCO1/2